MRSSRTASLLLRIASHAKPSPHIAEPSIAASQYAEPLPCASNIGRHVVGVAGFQTLGEWSARSWNRSCCGAGRRFSQAAIEVEADFGGGDVAPAPVAEERGEEVIKAVPRGASGKIICKKERRAGRVPSIVFGQENGHLGGDKQLLSVETKQIERVLKRIGKSFFLSRTFDLEIHDDEDKVQSKERVLPRSIHLHAGTDKVMNVTFIRAPPTARLKVDVPLVFIGEDACPGIRKGGYIYTMMRTVKYKCPGDAIPPCIEVDLSSLDMGHKILLRDLKVAPELRLVHTDSSLPVCKVMGSRVSTQTAAAAAT